MFSACRLPPAASRILRLSLCLIAGAGLVAAGAPGPRPGQPAVRRARYLMGTVLEIEALGARRPVTEEAVEAAFRVVAETEDRLSNWNPHSELSRANRGAAAVPFPLSPETFSSLTAVAALAEETGGAFDPTVGAVTEALGLTGGVPSTERAHALRETIGWRRARLDAARRTLRLENPGAVIDSGAFGKGEALDRAAAALRGRGVGAARLNFGGQILLFGVGAGPGRRADFSLASVAAPDSSGRELCHFKVGDGSVSTSGDAEKSGHLIDPRTGRAAPFHGSVTVVADTAFRADALSTALFVLGPREGIDFANHRGIAALYLEPTARGYSARASRSFPRFSCVTF